MDILNGLFASEVKTEEEENELGGDEVVETENSETKSATDEEKPVLHSVDPELVLGTLKVEEPREMTIREYSHQQRRPEHYPCAICHLYGAFMKLRLIANVTQARKYDQLLKTNGILYAKLTETETQSWICGVHVVKAEDLLIKYRILHRDGQILLPNVVGRGEGTEERESQVQSNLETEASTSEDRNLVFIPTSEKPYVRKNKIVVKHSDENAWNRKKIPSGTDFCLICGRYSAQLFKFRALDKIRDLEVALCQRWELTHVLDERNSLEVCYEHLPLMRKKKIFRPKDSCTVLCVYCNNPTKFHEVSVFSCQETLEAVLSAISPGWCLSQHYASSKYFVCHHHFADGNDIWTKRTAVEDREMSIVPPSTSSERREEEAGDGRDAEMCETEDMREEEEREEMLIDEEIVEKKERRTSRRLATNARPYSPENQKNCRRQSRDGRCKKRKNM